MELTYSKFRAFSRWNVLNAMANPLVRDWHKHYLIFDLINVCLNRVNILFIGAKSCECNMKRFVYEVIILHMHILWQVWSEDWPSKPYNTKSKQWNEYLHSIEDTYRLSLSATIMPYTCHDYMGCVAHMMQHLLYILLPLLNGFRTECSLSYASEITKRPIASRFLNVCETYWEVIFPYSSEMNQ